MSQILYREINVENVSFLTDVSEKQFFQSVIRCIIRGTSELLIIDSDNKNDSSRNQRVIVLGAVPANVAHLIVLKGVIKRDLMFTTPYKFAQFCRNLFEVRILFGFLLACHSQPFAQQGAYGEAFFG